MHLGWDAGQLARTAGELWNVPSCKRPLFFAAPQNSPLPCPAPRKTRQPHPFQDADAELAAALAAPAARPLAALRQDSAQLRLVPVDPPDSPPGLLDGGGYGGWGAGGVADVSPRLDSPMHALHSHWLRARAGLAEGRAPRLAAAGTGACLRVLCVFACILV